MKVFFVSFFSIFFLLVKNLYPVATCSGEICKTIPENYLQQIQELDLQFKIQYLDLLLRSMGEASAMANTGSGRVGLGSLNKFQVGVGGTASFLTNKPVNLAYKETTLSRLPNVGFSINPGFNLGVNLGWLLTKGGGQDIYLKDWEEDDDESKENEEENVLPTYFHRFNLYVHGMSLNSSVSDFTFIKPKKFGVEGDLSISQYGLDLRYMLFTSYLQQGFFRFMGMSVGVGYHRLKNDLQLTVTKANNTQFKVGPYIGAWVGNSNLDYEMTVVSIPVDLRVGFEFFKFFTLFGGGGFVKSDIDGSVLLARGGPLKLSLDPNFTSVANALTPALFQTLQEVVKQEGYLDIRITSQQKFSFSNGYGLVGFEISLGPIQFVAEGIFFANSGSGNIAIKANF